MAAPAYELQRRLIRAMSPEEKLRASEALRAAAWELKAAWLRSQHSDWSDDEVHDAVRRWFRDAAA